MPHLALVPKAKSSPLDLSNDENGSSTTDATCNTTYNNIRTTDLTALYESYASLYPNPRLMQEVRERHTLLTAASAAQRAQQQQANPPPSPPKKRSGGGFFTRLFGGVRESEPDEPQLSLGDDVINDDRLLYGDYITDDSNGINVDDSEFLLCGTGHSVDVACIPPEAHAMARFHLASCGRTNGSGSSSSSSSSTSSRPPPNIARNAWERPGSTLVVITGLGQVMEFPYSSSSTSSSAGAGPAASTSAAAASSNGTGGGGGGILQYTSDCEDLKDFVAGRGLQFQTSHVRAAMIGPNLLVVSWGLMDGCVVFYRRLAAVPSTTGGGSGGGTVTWEAVACIQPSPVVQEHLGDVFAEGGAGSAHSALLIATDVLPIVVELGKDIPAAAVAISRLGGFIELVPLPPRMWYGDKLPVDKKNMKNVKQQERMRQQRAARRRKLYSNKNTTHHDPSKVPHYAAKLVNINAENNSSNNSTKTKVVSTLDYHTDVIGLAAFRTRVNVERTAWDRQRYPHTPPAEHVLCAFGTMHGRERLTFWSVSTLFTNTKQQERQDADEIGFALHVVLSEAIDVGPLGPDMTIFATNNILKHWRKPRHVQLRESSSSSSSSNDDEAASLAQQEEQAKKENPVTTISVSMPIVSLRVSVSSQAALLAALDGNGGTTLLDCALLEKMASQSLSDQEHAVLYQTPGDGEEQQEAPPALVTTTAVRSHLAKALSIAERRIQDRQRQSFSQPPSIVDIQYLSPRLSSAMAGSSSSGGDGSSDNAGPVLAVLTEKRLHLLTTNDVNAGKSQHSIAVAQLDGAAMHILLREGLVLVVRQQQESQHSQQLSVWTVQQLDPSDIVQSLVHERKYREAVNSAMKLGQADQARLSDTIQECRQRLWEAGRNDLDCLAAITDDSYLVQQALSISAGQSEIRSTANEMNHCRSALLLALDRLSNVRLGPAIVMAGLEGTDSIQTQVCDRLIRLGTYEILCQLMDVEPSIQHFGESFLEASIVELALCFARAADIRGLSVLYFRHRRAILTSDVLVVDEIPATIPPNEYQHLLPISCNSGHDDRVAFLSGEDDEPVCDWSMMPQYLTDRFDIDVSLNEKDQNIVVESTALDSAVSLSSEVLEDFYLKRSRAIQWFSGSLEHPMKFSHLALAALGSSCSSSTVDYFQGFSGRAQALQKILLQSETDFAPPALVTLTLEDLEQMDIVDLIAIILDGQSDSVEVFSRFRCYIQPLLPHVAGGANDALVGNAISSYCIKLLQDNLVTTKAESQAQSWLRALDVCGAILSLSRTSMPIQSRLIKTRASLLELVLNIFSTVANGVGGFGLSSKQHRHVLDSLWTMYESLPLQLPESEKDEPELAGLMKRASEMFRLLVAADMLSGWPGCVDSFDFVRERLSDKERSIEAGDFADVVVDMCRSFCQQVSGPEPASEVYERSELLSSLLSDIREFNRVVSCGMLPVNTLVTENLFEPLLRQQHIGLLDDLLSSSHGTCVDKEMTSQAILSYINEVVFSDGENGDIQSAMGAGRLGRHFPELHQELAESRRFVDAAHFLNSVLLANSGTPIRPDDIRKQNPIDVVESVLTQSPESITRDCEHWADESFARDANQSIRHYHKTIAQNPDHEPTAHDLNNLPALPAGAVYHLAGILGLQDGAAVVAVKCRVVNHANRMGFYGAAAAVSRSMLLDKFESYSEAQQVAALDAVARTVTQPSYGDIETKKELCSLVLSKFRGPTSTENIEAFGQILAVCSGSQGLLTEADQAAAPVSSIDRLCRDTMREYSMDLRELFLDLHQQAADGFIDDSLLKAISRHALFWSIADATRPKEYLPNHLEQDDSFAVRSLGSALLVHMQDREMAEACFCEIQSILSEQGAIAERFESSDNDFMASEDIIRQLVGRGYSELGARRSALMSGNRGVDEALQWAIAHSHEPDFDDPIVLVKRKGSHVDMIGVRRLEATLELSGRLLAGKLDPSVLSAASQASVGQTVSRSSASTRSTPIEPIANGNGRVVKVASPPKPRATEATTQSRALAVDSTSVVERKTHSPSNGSSVSKGPKKVLEASAAPSAPSSRFEINQPHSVPATSPTPQPSVSQSVANRAKPGLDTAPAVPPPVSQAGNRRPESLVNLAPATTAPASRLSKSTAKSKLVSEGRSIFTSSKTQISEKAQMKRNTGIPAPSSQARVPLPVRLTPPATTKSKASGSGVKAAASTTPDVKRLVEEARALPRSLGVKPRSGVTAPITALKPTTRPRLDVSNVFKAKTSTTPDAPKSAPLSMNLLAGCKASSSDVPPPPSSADRLSLREQGQAALTAARNACSPEGDERRRLIEEGRRLLLKARHDKDKSPASTPAKSLNGNFARQSAVPAVSPPPPPPPPSKQQPTPPPPPSQRSDSLQQKPQQPLARVLPSPRPPTKPTTPNGPDHVDWNDEDGWNFEEEEENEPDITTVREMEVSHPHPPPPPPRPAMPATVAPIVAPTPIDVAGTFGVDDLNIEDDGGWDFEQEAGVSTAQETTRSPPREPASMPTEKATRLSAPAPIASASTLIAANDDIDLNTEDDAGWYFEDEEDLTTGGEAAVSDNMTEHEERPPPPPPVPGIASSLASPVNHNSIVEKGQEGDDDGGWDFDEDDLGSAADDGPPPPLPAAAATTTTGATESNHLNLASAISKDNDEKEESSNGGWNFDDF